MRSEELIMNITGPKAEPWTTLELISSDWEREELNFVRWDLF
jgi:hypothetical protein